MTSYDVDDMVKYYFICDKTGSMEIRGSRKRGSVIAWSDDANLIKAYITFHKCSNHYIRTVEDRFQDIIKILNDAEIYHKQLAIVNLTTRNRSGKHRDDLTEIIQLPLTNQEEEFISDIIADSYGSLINYLMIDDFYKKLKPRYRAALKSIGLIDMMNSSMRNVKSEFANSIIMDELMILIMEHRSSFG
jgi:hypothetical protein